MLSVNFGSLNLYNWYLDTFHIHHGVVHTATREDDISFLRKHVLRFLQPYFYFNSFENRQNCRIWRSTSPHVTQEKPADCLAYTMDWRNL